jgi:hypothetical protein
MPGGPCAKKNLPAAVLLNGGIAGHAGNGFSPPRPCPGQLTLLGTFHELFFKKNSAKHRDDQRISRCAELRFSGKTEDKYPRRKLSLQPSPRPRLVFRH